MGKKKKRKPFHCTSEAQKRAIRASYARQAAENNNQPVPKETNFKLPLKNGGHRWNIFRVSNTVLNGKNDGDVHGGLVLDEENGNVMLAQVTHSSRKGKRNNIPIRNLKSDDLDKDGNLKNSYIERRLIVCTDFDDDKIGITINALKDQINDLQFTEAEKQAILDELSHLSTAEERYKLFLELAKRKGDT